MNKEWQEVREQLGEHKLTLGSVYAYQALYTPRNYLFALSRYKFASRLLPQDKPVDVLELGCGEGIGTIMLSENGHRIVAVDFDEVSINYARENIIKPNISFQRENFLGKNLGKFDAIVSLDVIEHIAKAQENVFFETISENLNQDGFCIIGTPNATAKQYASPLSEIGHINLYTAERLKEVMNQYFKNTFFFGMNDEVVHTGFYPMCHYLFGLGVGKIKS